MTTFSYLYEPHVPHTKLNNMNNSDKEGTVRQPAFQKSETSTPHNTVSPAETTDRTGTKQYKNDN